MSIPEMVTDRTPADVAAGNEKGVYGAADMNRVEGAVSILAEELRNMPGALADYGGQLGVAWDADLDLPWDPSGYDLTVKTDWTMRDVPRTSDMKQYLGNIGTLAEAFGTELEYLESTGTQYIDTGYYPHGTELRVVLDLMLTSNARGQGLFGAIDSLDIYTTTNNRVTAEASATGKYANYSARAQTVLAAGTRYLLEADMRDWVISMAIDGNTVSENDFPEGPELTLTVANSLYLFADNYEGPDGYGLMRLYGCQIYEGETLVRDYIPCRMGGNAGLMDRMSGKLCENAGSGEFMTGPETESRLAEGLPDTMNHLTWAGANAIEKTLEQLDAGIRTERQNRVDRLERTAAGLMAFAGTDLYSGEWS